MFCKNCGEMMGLGQNTCTNCGFKENTGNNYCEFCGEKVEPDDEICVYCGCKMTTAADLAAEKAKGGTKSQKILNFVVLGLGILSLANSLFGTWGPLTSWGTLLFSIIAMIVVNIIVDKKKLNYKQAQIGQKLAKVAFWIPFIYNIIGLVVIVIAAIVLLIIALLPI